MKGTPDVRKAAGRKISASRRAKDPDIFRKLGAMGGKKGKADGVIKGFAAVPGLASRAGILGGKARQEKLREMRGE